MSRNQPFEPLDRITLTDELPAVTRLQRSAVPKHSPDGEPGFPNAEDGRFYRKRRVGFRRRRDPLTEWSSS